MAEKSHSVRQWSLIRPHTPVPSTDKFSAPECVRASAPDDAVHQPGALERAPPDARRNDFACGFSWLASNTSVRRTTVCGANFASNSPPSCAPPRLRAQLFVTLPARQSGPPEWTLSRHRTRSIHHARGAEQNRLPSSYMTSVYPGEHPFTRDSFTANASGRGTAGAAAAMRDRKALQYRKTARREYVRRDISARHITTMFLFRRRHTGVKNLYFRSSICSASQSAVNKRRWSWASPLLPDYGQIVGRFPKGQVEEAALWLAKTTFPCVKFSHHHSNTDYIAKILRA